MAKKDNDGGEVTCPVCQVLERVHSRCERLRSSKFAQHLRNARMEVLMAVRSVIDDRIDELKQEEGPKKTSRRIKVKEAE